MAIFTPKLQYAREHCRPTPQPGELQLLEKLTELDDTYSVYFQPFLDGDIPDVVILKKGCGACIIEVKDYNPQHYKYYKTTNKYGALHVLNDNNTQIMTPMEQVDRYKKNIYNLHNQELGMANIQNEKLFGIIHVSVYFACEIEKNVKNLFSGYDDRYMGLWGYDSNIIQSIQNKLTRTNLLFTDALYGSMKILFTPSFNRISQDKPFELSDRQKELAVSQDGKSSKIRGVAGSGKTIVLAQKAINAYERTNDDVLILTFNITICNYIKDKISQFRSGAHKRNFRVVHFHGFLKQQCAEYGVPSADEVMEIDEWTKKRIHDLKNRIDMTAPNQQTRFSTILIDEVQDFEYNWLDFIKKNYLKQGGEYTLFGDEKQNIYGKVLDNDKKPNVNVKGRWTELNESFRLKALISTLANQFQVHFMQNKYNIEEIEPVQMTFEDGVKEDIEYHEVAYNNIPVLWNTIENYKIKNGLANNDICILSSSVEILRSLEKHIRTEKMIHTTMTFEQEEMLQQIQQIDNERSEMDRERIRAFAKSKFWMNTGKIKMSTTHSFKGWESHTLVIILDKNMMDNDTELMYTALTRCTNNLIIINPNIQSFGVNEPIVIDPTIKNEYQTFFAENINKRYYNGCLIEPDIECNV